MSLVLNSFIKKQLTVKSRELVTDLVKGHASNPYNIIGIHLLEISCKMTSSDAGSR